MATYPVITGAEPWSAPGRGSAADVGIVVAHGFTGNPVSTRPLGEALSEHGYAVEVPRLPGHGTHWRDLARTRYRDWRRAVERALDDLGTRCSRIVVVGLSVGGTIALDLAAERCRAGDAGPLTGVATINAMVLSRRDPLARLAPVLQYLVPAVPAKRAGITENDIAMGGDERAYPTVPAKAGYSLTRELPRIRRALGAITVPVLVATSRQDHTVAPANGQAIAQAVGTDDVTELALERSFHVATLDHDAGFLADEISAFVARVTETADTRRP